MLLVFLGVAILGWSFGKLGKASEEKKGKIRKYFFAFYGLFLIAQGGLHLWDEAGIGWLALNIPLGIIITWAALSGKLEPANKLNSYFLNQSSRLNNSSTLHLKIRASFSPSSREGKYLLFSMALMVCRETWSWFARSSWVMSWVTLCILMVFFMVRKRNVYEGQSAISD